MSIPVPSVLLPSVLLLCNDSGESGHVSEMLLHGPYNLVCAGNLDEALEQFRSNFTDVAIVCQQTGVLDGFQAARELRVCSPSLQTIVIGLGDNKSQFQSALDAGVAAYLPRPVTPEQLTAALARCEVFSTNRHDSVCPACPMVNADPNLGIIRVDWQGRILFANSIASKQLCIAGTIDNAGFPLVAARCLRDYRGYRSGELIGAVADGRPWNGKLAGFAAAADSVFDCSVVPADGTRGHVSCSVLIRDISAGSRERDSLVFERGKAADLLMFNPSPPDSGDTGTFKLAAVIEQAFGRCDMRSFQLNLPAHIPECFQGKRRHVEDLFIGLAAHVQTLKGLQGGSLKAALKEKHADSIRLVFEFTARSSRIAVNRYESIADYIGSLETQDASGLQATGIFLAAARVAENGEFIRVKRMAGETISFSFCLNLMAAEPGSEVSQTLANTRSGSAHFWVSPPIISRKNGLRILVADDSPVDQLGLRSMIEKSGHDSIVFVGNGREALEEFEQGDYDLVFMDILMPVMDGFEATRMIRQQERLSGRHTPVLALTSYSLKAVHDKCLSVGMDGYLSKPVNQRDITHVFLLLTGSTDTSGLAREDSSAAALLPILDIAGILENYGGDVELLQNIVEIFEPQAEPEFILLEQALSDSASAIAGPAAHKLKGIASSVGGVRFADLMRSIDERVQTDTLLDYQELREKAASEYDLLKRAVSAIDWDVVKSPAG
jgi:CheY-like chemotaxis protein